MSVISGKFCMIERMCNLFKQYSTIATGLQKNTASGFQPFTMSFAIFAEFFTHVAIAMLGY